MWYKLNLIKFTGYHATESESAKDIIKNGFDTSRAQKRDDHWLGKGIYLFKYKTDAQTWTKSAPYIKNGPCVLECKVKVQSNYFLDLDDPKQMNDFLLYFDSALNELSKSGAIFSFKKKEQAMHYGLDLYKEEYNIQMIKKTFKNNRTANVNNYYNLGYIKTEWIYPFSEVQYCVTNSISIFERSLVV